MKIIPINLTKNGFSYTQLLREGNKAIYEQSVTASVKYYEVFSIRTRPERILKGKTKLFIHAKYAADIVSALEFSKRQGIQNPVLVTGSQVLEVLDLIIERKIAVVLNRIHSLPLRPEDPVHLPIQVTAKLKESGVLFTLDYEGDMEVMGSRNLAFLAGSTTRYGLSNEDALTLITSNAARILDIDAFTGSLEQGKDATFFISEGLALNMSTQTVTSAWIQGRPISLESKQTALYAKFRRILDEGRY